MEETWVPGENHRPVASHWQPVSHDVVSNLHLKTPTNRVKEDLYSSPLLNISFWQNKKGLEEENILQSLKVNRNGQRNRNFIVHGIIKFLFYKSAFVAGTYFSCSLLKVLVIGL
jgi:hypothetical protein